MKKKWFAFCILILFIFTSSLKSFENLEHLGNEYSWMDELIDHEFRLYSNYGIDPEGTKVTLPHDFILVTIKNGEPQFAPYLPGNFYYLIHALCKTYTIPDVEFIYFNHDGLDYSPNFNAPVFVGCRRGNMHDVILFGDWYFHPDEWQAFLDELMIKREQIPWSDRKNQIIWRGKNTDGYYTKQNYMQFSRGLAVISSLKYPEIIDARFNAPDPWRTLEPLPSELMGNYINPIDQLQYKYHLSIRGCMCGYPQDRWKLFTGSTVFWVPHHHEKLWYHYPLKPYVHYIPTETSPEALLASFQWAEQNPNQAEQIAKNAKQFAEKNLQTSHLLFFMSKVLKKYASLNEKFKNDDNPKIIKGRGRRAK